MTAPIFAAAVRSFSPPRSRPAGPIAVSTRIGITKDADRPLRFFERGNPFVSGPRQPERRRILPSPADGMTPAVTLVVLVAAFCHASWNAIIRMRGDKLVSMALLVTAAGVARASRDCSSFRCCRRAAWPYVITSAIVHLGYNTFLALAYHHGELTKVYPLVRGSAPLATLVISLLFLERSDRRERGGRGSSSSRSGSWC